MLNFTQIVFDYKIYSNFNDYRLLIAIDTLGEIYNEENKIIDTTHHASCILINDKISFNKKYKWKYFAINANKKIVYSSPSYYFTTGFSNLIDTNFYKIKFRKNETKERFIVMSDAMKIAFNNLGKPIWYLNNSLVNNVRDLVLTPKGTLTFLNLNQAFETDLYGNIIWTPPNDGQVSKDSTEKYHHDFTLLKNGNYIICGQKKFNGNEEQNAIGNSLYATTSNAKINSSTIIEYNKNKQVIWSFDLIPELKRNFNIDVGNEPLMLRVGHLNGIDVDEKKGYVYASFKTFNSIFKIKKINNSIEYIFGNKQINLKDSLKANLQYFAAQHAPILLKNGNLMVFNNNEQGKVSSIVELSNPKTFNEELNKVWEFKFDEGGFEKAHSEHLGSVQEVANNSFFVCAGAVNRIFEVNKTRKISWDILTESNVNFGKLLEPNWQPISSYRAFKYSSLYPYYFSIQYSFNFKKMNQKNTVVVFNKGTEMDEYFVQYYALKNNIESIVYSHEEKINAGNKIVLSIKSAIISKNKVTKIVFVSKNSSQEIGINLNN